MLIATLTEKKQAKPFLKWAGGKRWLVSKYLTLFPESYNRYIEPFLGSASVFFQLCPQNAILSDINKDLIETYVAIKENWHRVFEVLKEHHNKHCRDYYYKIRRSKPRSVYTRAARIIYLNRTCWNGIYRVNRNGDFNVPIGTKSNVVLDTDNFEEISQLLQNVKLENKSYKDIIEQAEKGDLLFVDPPYTVKHDNNGFIKYNEILFSWEDQECLSKCLRAAKERGATIIHTNANNRLIRELYKDYFKIIPVTRKSVIAADSAIRGKCNELIITNY